MTDNSISTKVWGLATVLMNDGISNTDYLEQITFLLFLKMIDENHKIAQKIPKHQWNLQLPDGCDWQTLISKTGDEQLSHYKIMLSQLKNQKGMIGEVFRGAECKIQRPTNLAKVVNLINGIEWNMQSSDVKGDLYESLLERIGQDVKSGAGQYFTPRALISTIVRCVDPQLGRTIADPCCGSGGFLLEANKYLVSSKELSGDEAKQLRVSTFSGTEIVDKTYRLCLMNLLLHGIGKIDGEAPIKYGDSLLSEPAEKVDYVLTNPPFGKKSTETIEKQVKDKNGNEVTRTVKEQGNYSRTDFVAATSNKQLNFLQHIKAMLREGGTAAVVLPDNVLFEGGAGEKIRSNLLKTCNLHTILRLPTGIFYAQGVKANVLFFEKRPTSASVQTKDVWVYDYRTGINHTLKQNPLTADSLNDFVNCYCPGNIRQRTETYNADNNPEGRWRRFAASEILKRDKVNLDLQWLRQNSCDSQDLSLAELTIQLQNQCNAISQAASRLSNMLSSLPQ